MSPESTRSGTLGAAWRDLLHRPLRLRVVLSVVLLGSWYAGVYRPLQGQIDRAAARLDGDRERLALARDVERLRRESGRFAPRLPPPGDGNQWVGFLMDGVRRVPLKLVALEPRPPVDVGPYRATVLRLVVEGPYPDLERFLRWLEDAPRLVRIDAIRIAPRPAGGPGGGGGNGGPAVGEMQLLVMGVNG